MITLRQKVFRGFAWDFSGRAAQQLVTFALGIILARLLGPKDFGLVAMAAVFISYTNIFTDLGLTSALIQRKAAESIHFSSFFFLNLSISSLFLAAMFFAAPLIASFYGVPALTPIARVLGLNFVLTSFTSVQQVYLQKSLDFRALRTASFISAVTSGGLGIAMAYLGYGVWSLVAQSVVSSLLSSILLWRASVWRPSLAFSLAALRDLWSYGFNMFLAGMLETFAQRVDVLVIGKMFDATSLGFYSKAKSINRFITQYSSQSVGAVAFPALAEIQDDEPRLRRATLRMIDVVTFVSLAIAGVLYVAARPLIILLLTEKWAGAIPLFELLCWSGMFYPINAAQLSILRAQGNSALFLRLAMVKKTFYFTIIAIGFSIGMRGFLIALIVQSVIGTSINLRYTGEALGLTFQEQVLRTGRSIGAMAGAVVVAMLVPPALGLSGLYVRALVGVLLFTTAYLVLSRVLAPWALMEFLGALRSGLSMMPGRRPGGPKATGVSPSRDNFEASDTDGL